MSQKGCPACNSKYGSLGSVFNVKQKEMVVLLRSRTVSQYCGVKAHSPFQRGLGGLQACWNNYPLFFLRGV